MGYALAYVDVLSRADDDGDMIDVAKKSQDKISVGGRKFALRRRSADGVAEAEVIGIGSPPENDGDDRSLLVELVREGAVVGREPLADSRARHLAARDELPIQARSMSRGEPVIPTVYLPSAR